MTNVTNNIGIVRGATLSEVVSETGAELSSNETTSAVSEIDFSKYRTAELFSTVADLISLPGKLRTIVRWTVIGVVIALLIIGLLMFHRVPFLLWALIETYAIPAGAVAGLFFGIAEMIRRSMNGMLSIVDLLLKTTADVAHDARSLQSGESELPPPSELVFAVYDNVIYPIVEQVISGAFGFIGRPILWLYRRTLDRLVRVVVRRYVPKAYDDDQDQVQQTIKQGVLDSSQTVANNESAIVDSLQWARKKVESIGGFLKLLIMLPCYVLFGIVLTLVLLPIVVFAFLAEAVDGGSEQAPAVVISWIQTHC